jgi:putative endonuclease
MFHVYLLKSINFPKKVYIGFTEDLSARIDVHNSGGSVHTKKYKPWKLISCISFCDAKKALGFEKYLKSGSGRAFAKRHFW